MRPIAASSFKLSHNFDLRRPQASRNDDRLLTQSQEPRLVLKRIREGGKETRSLGHSSTQAHEAHWEDTNKPDLYSTSIVYIHSFLARAPLVPVRDDGRACWYDMLATIQLNALCIPMPRLWTHSHGQVFQLQGPAQARAVPDATTHSISSDEMYPKPMHRSRRNELPFAHWMSVLAQ